MPKYKLIHSELTKNRSNVMVLIPLKTLKFMLYKHKYGREMENLIKKAAKNPKLLRKFLSDLLSPAEYKDLAVRWQIIKLLAKGAPQREIAEKLHVSIATVTRGSREFMNKKGGFAQILKKYY